MSVTVAFRDHAVNLPRPKLQRVKKQLFGPAEAFDRKFVEDELEKNLRVQGARWNFDFEKEATLEPDGVYAWRPGTPPARPARPVKRRPSSDEQYDIGDLYCFPAEKSPEKKKSSQQTLITDFMQIKKNATQLSAKKMSGRPAKIARTSIAELQSTS